MTTDPAMYRHSSDRNPALLSVEGELDLFEGDRFRTEAGALLQRAKSGAVLDLGRLTFIDSAGIHHLLWVLDEARTRGIELRVVIPGGAVGRVLETTGVARLLAEPQSSTAASLG
jgi:anti-anti-sigma factor